MEKNKFVLEPSTKEVIDKSSINSGHGTIDCNYSRVYSEIKNSTTNYDHTNNRDIYKHEFIYLPNYPSKVISYEDMINYGKNKYYWDALGQKLYKFSMEDYPTLIYKGEVASTSELPKQNNVVGDTYLVLSYDNKGQVDSVLDLPESNNQIGDVYTVTSLNEKYYWAGENWVLIQDVYATKNMGKKYYWTGEDWNKIVKPFVKQYQEIVGCESNPSTGGVAENSEFTKYNGIWKEIFPDHAVSDYITIKGHPSGHALRPYVENKIYFDIVNNKYYYFISNYTRNINKWYYNKNSDNGEISRFIYESEREVEPTKVREVSGSWTKVNDCMVVSGNPNDLIKITDGSSISDSGYQYTFDIDDIDKTICYCDRNADNLYYFDYGQYFERILCSGVIYERPFEFYRKMQDVFLDINSTNKILMKSICYVGGHPKKVKSPREDRYYYDTKHQKYYTYNKTNKTWTEIIQENLLVPQTYFPHTHGIILQRVTLDYYNIIDCYTKKEFDKLIPEIPKYISAFQNDKDYFTTHQDISGKQDKLSSSQMNALNSGILSSKITTYNSFINLVNSKADRSDKLHGYGIEDAYNADEIESCLNNLTEKLNDA